MDTTTMSLHVVATLLLFLSATEAVLPNGQCSVKGMTCEFQDENQVGIISGVTSAEECKLVCENTRWPDSTDCQVYSFYEYYGILGEAACFLFKECQNLIPLDDPQRCFTEEIDCVVQGKNLGLFEPQIKKA